MRGGRIFLCFVLVISSMIFPNEISRAASSSDLVISHVITGESSNSSSEFIAIYNNSNQDIDMTDFCIKNKSLSSVVCISGHENTKVYIRSNNYLTFASTVFAVTHDYVPDTSYVSSNSFQVGGDVVSLIDSSGSEIDRMTWGTSGGSISSTTNGTLYRKQDPDTAGRLLDTNVMSNDFINAANNLIYPQNASYDQVTIVDYCQNIDETQTVIPDGYLLDEYGNCQADSCLNMNGLQISVPNHYDGDVFGNCYPQDECANLSGIQTSIPTNMIRKDSNECIWDIAPIILNELLPNAIGTDTGNEFIEVYNPTDRVVDLSLYSVVVGVTSDRTYTFPVGATIAPGEYRVFSDSLMRFTLVNTAGRIILKAIDGTTLSDSGIYENAPEGQSWALIKGLWLYTNRPTPGSENAASLVQDEIQTEQTDSLYALCSSGKYRNPLTNRCRTISSDISVIASCDNDQYRNPETGRCKKISASTLAPCRDNQYRSEETNRCRNITTVTSRKPCRDNQYRSEETGRCRNLPSDTVPNANFGIQSVKDSPMTFIGWWALGIITCFAIAYGIWEWRNEIIRFTKRSSMKK